MSYKWYGAEILQFRIAIVLYRNDAKADGETRYMIARPIAAISVTLTATRIQEHLISCQVRFLSGGDASPIPRGNMWRSGLRCHQDRARSIWQVHNLGLGDPQSGAWVEGAQCIVPAAQTHGWEWQREWIYFYFRNGPRKGQSTEEAIQEAICE